MYSCKFFDEFAVFQLLPKLSAFLWMMRRSSSLLLLKKREEIAENLLFVLNMIAVLYVKLQVFCIVINISIVVEIIVQLSLSASMVATQFPSLFQAYFLQFYSHFKCFIVTEIFPFLDERSQITSS